MHKFVIPNLNKEDKRIPISSVVLSGQRMDLRDALYTAGKDKAAGRESAGAGRPEADSQRDARIQPEPRHVCLSAGLRARRHATQPLVAFVTFYRGRAKAFETPPLPVTEGLDTKTKAVPLRFSLALGKLPPGRYNCQVTRGGPGRPESRLLASAGDAGAVGVGRGTAGNVPSPGLSPVPGYSALGHPFVDAFCESSSLLLEPAAGLSQAPNLCPRFYAAGVWR